MKINKEWKNKFRKYFDECLADSKIKIENGEEID